MRTGFYQLFVALLLIWTAGAIGYVIYVFAELAHTGAKPEAQAAMLQLTKLTGMESAKFLDFIKYTYIGVTAFVWAIGTAALGVIALLFRPADIGGGRQDFSDERSRLDDRAPPRF